MRPVAARYLHDRVRGATGWAVGVLALVLSTAALYPSIKGQRSFEETFNNLPQGVRALFGAEGALAITSAPGYLHARLFAALLPVLLLIFGIGVGVAAIAGSEEDGTLEFLLANPISRRRVVAGRYVAVVALVATVTAVAALTLLAVAPVFGLFDRTTPWRLAVATAASGLLAILHASLGFALGCALGRRSVALGATTAVAVAGYFLQVVVAILHVSPVVAALTPWHWYLARTIVTGSVSPYALVVPAVLSLALAAAGAALFDRRDLR